MNIFFLLRKADDLGINFWLRWIAGALAFSLFFLTGYYFLFINRDQTSGSVAVKIDAAKILEAEKRKADAALSARIKATIAQTARLYNYGIGVDNRDGVVTLTGDVASEIDKELAGNIAKETPGVKEIKNEIRLSAELARGISDQEKNNLGVNVEDLEMEANLREQILSVPELKEQAIKIKVRSREVVLSGSVALEQQRVRAEQIVRTSPKVERVNNQIRVGN